MTQATTYSSKPSWGTDPQCNDCGRSLAGYGWKFQDGSDGYICTAAHERKGGNVAYMKYFMENDEWVLRPRE